MGTLYIQQNVIKYMLTDNIRDKPSLQKHNWDIQRSVHYNYTITRRKSNPHTFLLRVFYDLQNIICVLWQSFFKELNVPWAWFSREMNVVYSLFMWKSVIKKCGVIMDSMVIAETNLNQKSNLTCYRQGP